MRVLFAGTPRAAMPSLEALVTSGHEVVGVLTRPDAPKGRGRTLHPSPIAEVAEKYGIPVLKPRSLRDPEAQQQVRELNPGAAAVVAYGQLVPADLLDLFPWVNLHFSLLPRWRGAAPVQRAIEAGDDVTGVCAFLLEEGLDTGPVLEQLLRPIGSEETAGEVLESLALQGAPVLVAAMDSLERGTAEPAPQPESGVTLAPKVTVEEARVDWSTSTREIVNRIRAFTPAPGAWTSVDGGTRVKLRPVRPVVGTDRHAAGAGDPQAPDRSGTGAAGVSAGDAGSDVARAGDAGSDMPGTKVLAPGEVSVSKQEVLVGTGDGAVRLGEVAPAGKSWMDAAAWGRGLRGEVRFVVGNSA